MARLLHMRGAACAALLLAACGEHSTNEQREMSASDLEVAMSALENPIISCQIQAGECVQNATELSALQACRMGIGDCLRAAGERVQKVAAGVGACREEQRKCLLGGGAQNGSCFDGFQACVEALASASGDAGAAGVPGQPDAGMSSDAGVASSPGSDDGGLGVPVPPRPNFPTSPTSDGGAPSFPGLGEAGLPGSPPFPGLGDAGLSGFPQLPGFPRLPGSECREGLRACLDKPDSDLIECAGEARECLIGAAVSPLPFP